VRLRLTLIHSPADRTGERVEHPAGHGVQACVLFVLDRGERGDLGIGELTAKSPEFRRGWADHRVFELSHGIKRLHHPVIGDIDLHFEVFPVSGSPGQQLVVYQAQPGSPAEESLRILASWAADNGTGR